MVNKSKKMEVNEMIKPNIINGLDLTFSSCLGLFFEEEEFLPFVELKFEKGLITINVRIKLVTLKF